MPPSHRHQVMKGAILDPTGYLVLGHWFWCGACGQRLGEKMLKAPVRAR